MIDFLKVLIIDPETIARIRINPLLCWSQSVEKLWFDKETIRAKDTYEFDGILFCFYQRKLEILFKPHYYFNKNLHNANDFSAVDCMDTIIQFVTLFQIRPTEARIINMEYGLNLISPIGIEDLITYIKYHRRNPFATQDGLRYSKISNSTNRRGKANSYKQIKCYAKAIQMSDEVLLSENIHPDTFRFEIKSKRSAYIKTLGVSKVEDLLNVEVYLNMQQSLLKEFSNILILDHSASPKLTSKERTSLDMMLNPDTWYRFENHKNRNRFSIARRKYHSLINRDPHNLKSRIAGIITNKLSNLCSGCKFHTYHP